MLAGCEPTMYVPHPLPSPPMRPGTVASGEVDGVARATFDLSSRPIESASFHARVYAGRADTEDGPADTVNGGEVGATFLYPFQERTFETAVELLPSAEIGLSAGRDRMGSDGVSGITDRYAAHGGVVVSNVDRHLGLLVRVTTVNTHDVVRDATGEPYTTEDERGTFLEPVVRFGHQTQSTEFSAQFGLSYILGDRDRIGYRYSYVPFIVQARVGFRL